MNIKDDMLMLNNLLHDYYKNNNYYHDKITSDEFKDFFKILQNNKIYESQLLMLISFYTAKINNFDTSHIYYICNKKMVYKAAKNIMMNIAIQWINIDEDREVIILSGNRKSDLKIYSKLINYIKSKNIVPLFYFRNRIKCYNMNYVINKAKQHYKTLIINHKFDKSIDYVYGYPDNIIYNYNAISSHRTDLSFINIINIKSKEKYGKNMIEFEKEIDEARTKSNMVFASELFKNYSYDLEYIEEYFKNIYTRYNNKNIFIIL